MSKNCYPRVLQKWKDARTMISFLLLFFFWHVWKVYRQFWVWKTLTKKCGFTTVLALGTCLYFILLSLSLSLSVSPSFPTSLL
jgi:hypothetical protein